MKKFILFFALFLAGSITVNAQAPFMTPISGPSNVCSSPSAPVTFSAIALNSPTSYSWSVVSPAGVVIGNPTGSITTISFPYSAGTYTIYCYAINGFGNSNTVSIVVNVFETPTVTFSGANTFCQGSSTNLQASSTIIMASPTISYSWTPGYGLNAYNIPNVIASPTIATVYTVTATKGMCSNTGTFGVNILPAPALSVTAGPTVICQGNTTTLTATGAPIINWSGGITNGIGFTPAISNTYIATGVHPNGCSVTFAQPVTVNNPPNVMAFASDPTVCPGSSVYVNATGAVNYTWSGGVFNNVPFTPTVSSAYTVTGSSPGCPGTSTSSVFIFISPTSTLIATANPTSICAGESSTITITGNGISYSLSGTPCNLSAVVSPTQSTVYVVEGDNSYGCGNAVQNLSLAVSECVSVKEISADKKINLAAYPNPNNGDFILRSDENVTVTICNELGQIVRSLTLQAGTETKLQGLESGIYFVVAPTARLKLVITH